MNGVNDFFAAPVICWKSLVTRLWDSRWREKDPLWFDFLRPPDIRFVTTPVLEDLTGHWTRNFIGATKQAPFAHFARCIIYPTSVVRPPPTVLYLSIVGRIHKRLVNQAQLDFIEGYQMSGTNKALVCLPNKWDTTNRFLSSLFLWVFIKMLPRHLNSFEWDNSFSSNLTIDRRKKQFNNNL